MKKTVRELADLVGGKIIGSPDTVIVDVKSAEKASSEDITFATGIYAEHLDKIQPALFWRKRTFRAGRAH